MHEWVEVFSDRLIREREGENWKPREKKIKNREAGHTVVPLTSYALPVVLWTTKKRGYQVL